jgi:hypothetical protein
VARSQIASVLPGTRRLCTRVFHQFGFNTWRAEPQRATFLSLILNKTGLESCWSH